MIQKCSLSDKVCIILGLLPWRHRLMALIEHTNIIIDDFSIAKRQSNRIYTHILTHIHVDHLKGLHDGWNYGPIYCTKGTQELLLYRYPSLTCLNVLSINQPTSLKMSNTLEVTVTFLDANHCVGAVMVLIEGYMGRVLYTGDIRFKKSLFRGFTDLYPPHLANQGFEGCSKQVDVLYLDNTFLKAKFDFPPQQHAIEMVEIFIQHILDLNQHSRIFIGLDNIGKEEVLVAIAKHFNMYIVVDELRYELLKAMEGIDLELFSTRPEEGIVEVVRKDKLYRRVMETEGAMGIVLSGWVNKPSYRLKGRIYCVPYSLHSNYKEIHQFVNSIRPSFIYPIVHQFPDENKLFYAQTSLSRHDLVFNENIFEPVEGNYQDEIDLLRKLYCSPPTPEYNLLINDFELQKKIQQELLPPKMPEFSLQKTMVPVHLQTVERKRYKLKNTRNEQEISRLRNQILMKRRMVEGEPIQEIEDDCWQQGRKSSEKQVIDIDGIIDVEDQVVEVDPFKEGRPKGEKKRMFDGWEISEISDIIQEKNRIKLANNMQAEEDALVQVPRKDKISQIHLPPKQILTEVMRSKIHEQNIQWAPKSKPRASITEICLGKVDQISFLRTKSQIMSYLGSHPKDRSWLQGCVGDGSPGAGGD